MLCNVLCNIQHMIVYGQMGGACLVFIRLSGRAYRGTRGKLSISEELRLDPLFSLLTLPSLVLLFLSCWSILCNCIVLSMRTSSHSSVSITSHVFVHRVVHNIILTYLGSRIISVIPIPSFSFVDELLEINDFNLLQKISFLAKNFYTAITRLSVSQGSVIQLHGRSTIQI